MGAKPLIVSQRQVSAVLKGAAQAGVNVEVRIENGVVRFIPCEIENAKKPGSVDTKRAWHF